MKPNPTRHEKQYSHRRTFRFFALLSCFFLFQTLTAQHISVESFTMLPNDMDARVTYPKNDPDGRPSAIVKVVTTETGFSWDVGMVGVVDAVRRTGEYWLYLRQGTQRITISHDRLGVLRNYVFPIPIESATVYEMRLTTSRIETTIIEIEPETQWLVVTSVPDGADVYIDNIHKGQTPLQIELNTGTYSYRIEKPLYHPAAGRIELTMEDRSNINETLNPNYGFLHFTTQPESGAEITINGNRQSKTTPFTTDKLVSGSYQVTVSKPLYHTERREVVVLDGQTTDVNINLRPNFGVLSVNTKPEAGAEVLVNGISTGKNTPCELDRLPSGQHQITVRKEWYQPKTISVNIMDGQSDHFEIEMTPTFGTLSVQAEHDAEIFINNDHKATAGWEGRLIAGWYTVEARKDKYHSDQKRVEIKLGETQNLSLHPRPRTGALKIQTTPFDAKITLNGKDFGTTPATIRDLLIGNYSLALSKKGHATVTHAISILEDETVEITDVLPTGKSVTINSVPQKIDLYIDNQLVGKTPYVTDLKYGTYQIKLINQTRTTTESIVISQHGEGVFTFDVTLEKEVVIATKPEGATVNTKKENLGTTPATIRLYPGSHELFLKKDTYKTRKIKLTIDDKPAKQKFNLKPESLMGIGYIPKKNGVQGGLDVYYAGTLIINAGFLIPDAMYSTGYQEYKQSSMYISAGFRVPYPLDFSLLGGYGFRTFMDANDEDNYESFNSFIASIILPVYFTRKAGVYFKAEYWTHTENGGLFVYSIGVTGQVVSR